MTENESIQEAQDAGDALIRLIKQDANNYDEDASHPELAEHEEHIERLRKALAHLNVFKDTTRIGRNTHTQSQLEAGHRCIITRAICNSGTDCDFSASTAMLNVWALDHPEHVASVVWHWLHRATQEWRNANHSNDIANAKHENKVAQAGSVCELYGVTVELSGFTLFYTRQHDGVVFCPNEVLQLVTFLSNAIATHVPTASLRHPTY